MRTYLVHGGCEPAANAAHILANEAAWSSCAAEHVAWVLSRALQRRSKASLVLSGGSTPAAMYRLLADSRFGSKLDWDRIHIFWGDERLLPPDHPDSNFALAEQTLLSGIDIPEANIHRMPGESQDPSRAAASYSQTLQEILCSKAFIDEHARETSLAMRPCPRFDMLILGLGPDGHTASLFPGSWALAESQRWVVPVDPGPGQAKPSVPRLTLTLPILNRARNTLFLAGGPSKMHVARKILQDPLDNRFPASLIRPEGQLLWLLFDDRDQLNDWEVNAHQRGHSHLQRS